jgi:excisionase family DNA binding protein
MPRYHGDTLPSTALLTVSEVAGILRVSGETVRNWCAAGKLPAVQSPSGRWLVWREALEKELGAKIKG